MSAVWWLVAVGLTLSSLGCGGGSDAGSTAGPGGSSGTSSGSSGAGGGNATSGTVTDCEPTLASITATIFRPSCALSDCHTGSGPAGALDLVADNLEARLIGGESGTCTGATLVIAAAPDQSLLLQKLTGEVPTDCGTTMPPTGPLDDAAIECVRGWIASLSPDAGPPAPTCETCGGTACVDLQTDSTHCGSCGTVCGVDQFCMAASCASTASCGDFDACGGACVDTSASTAHCGSCNNACAPGQTCNAGQCACPTQSASFTADIEPVLDANCTNKGCHSGVKPKAGLDLSSGSSYTSLLGKSGTGVASGCGSKKYVDPGNPNNSYLVNLLTGTGLCAGDSQMPKIGQSLPSADLEAITAWICQGAAK